MITHIIYEIPGRKVGCTKNIEHRMNRYLREEGIIPKFNIREELVDKTDKEAGDIEWDWADKLGYRRGIHYTTTINQLSQVGKRGGLLGGLKGQIRFMEMTTEAQRKEWATKASLRARETVTSDELKERGRKGGLITSSKKTLEQHRELTKKALAKLTPEKRQKLGNNGAYIKRGRCPHCHLESNLANLYRWHYDNCPKRRKFLTRPKI